MNLREQACCLELFSALQRGKAVVAIAVVLLDLQKVLILEQVTEHKAELTGAVKHSDTKLKKQAKRELRRQRPFVGDERRHDKANCELIYNHRKSLHRIQTTSSVGYPIRLSVSGVTKPWNFGKVRPSYCVRSDPKHGSS